MAITIPTLDAPRVSSTGRATPFERTNHSADESPWAGVATAAEAGSQVMLAVQKAKKEADALAVREALNKQQQFLNAGLEEIKRAEGRNALEVAGKFYEKADLHAKEMYGSLANEEQRAAFTLEANENLTQLQRIGESHAGTQIKVAEEKEYQIAQGASLDKVAQYGDAPGVVEGEVASVSRRTLGRAQAMGLAPEAAEQLRNDEVGKLYMARAQVLASDPRRLGEAQALLQKHSTETGVAGAALLGKLNGEMIERQADDKAKAIVEAAGRNRLGAVNIMKARAEVDKLPSGPERDLVGKYVESRYARAEDGRKMQRDVRMETVRDMLIAQSNDPSRRSIDVLRSTPAGAQAWRSLDSDQQIALENMIAADQSAARGQTTLTDAQVQGYLSISREIETNPAVWGAAGAEKALTADPRYANLPEARRREIDKRVIDAATASQKAAGAGAQMPKPYEIAVAHALKVGVIGEKAETPEAKWSYESRLKALAIHDIVGRESAAWAADPKNVGKLAPSPEEIKSWVRKAHRAGEVEDFGSNTPMTEAAARARPAAEQREHPFILKNEADVDAQGREVLRLQGRDEKVHPEAFTPEAIARAQESWARLQSGPGTTRRAEIVAWLQAHRLKVTDANIQAKYESDELDYVK